MNKQRFITLVLLVSLTMVSGPGTVHTGAAPPVLSPSSGLGVDSVEGPALPVPSVAEGSQAEGASVPVEHNTGATTLPAGVSSDWWAAVQEDIRRSEYHVTWQDKTYLPDVDAPSTGLRAGAYQAPNRAYNLRTYFTPEGPVVIPRVWPEGAEAPPWRWGLSLVAWGREGALQPAGAATLHTDANRVEYHYVSQSFDLALRSIPERQRVGQDRSAILRPRPGQARHPSTALRTGPPSFDATQDRSAIVEWYLNDERGLEQGFTIQSPPLPRSPDPLLLELALSGDLSPRLADGGTAIEFTTTGGVRVLRYSDLHVTDATGRQLPAHFQLPSPARGGAGEGVIRLTVDDSNAVYPITVDPLATTPNWSAEGDQASAEFGCSVGTAGDVNGDGFADIIVGAENYDLRGAAFVYHGSACGLSTSADWTAEGDEGYGAFGYSAGTAGDVNNDGFADVIVGSNCYGNVTCQEAAFVWYGSATGLGANGTPSNADWRAVGDQVDARFGYSVGTAGDVNGDGYDDAIVGAYLYDHGQTDEGRAFVWYGSAAGLGADGTPSNADWSKESDQMYARFGHSVGTAGDVNGDGYDEAIVGAPAYDHGQTDEGLAFVYAGSASGLNSAPYWHAEGNLYSAALGHSVGTAGDVNGDGYDDVIVGAHGYDSDQTDEGAAFVWHGSPSGLGDDGTPTNADWRAEGDQIDAWFGHSVGTAGDVNGDGYDDVIVGARYYAHGTDDEGAAFVYRGSTSGLSDLAIWRAESDQADAEFGYSVGTAGDVNGDGFSDVIVGAHWYNNGEYQEGRAYVYHGSASGPSPDWTKESNKAYAEFGYSVGTAGDVNGDGYADVIVGARSYDHGQDNEGLAFVYAGSASGLNLVPYWFAESNQANAHLGQSVGTAGDVNGDGYGDVIVGAHYYAHGTDDEGAAFVWYGSATGLGANGTPDNADWTAESNREDAYFGVAVGTAGDVNGDGFSDVVVGADYFYWGSVGEGAAFVWHGSATGLGADGSPENADWTAESNQYEAMLGVSVGTAGDVNGDGYADLIIGADSYDDGDADRGMALVWYGSASGLGTAGTPDNADWTALGNQVYTYLGSSVGTAGDVNGDGYADIIVGAPGYYDGQSVGGGAFIWYGSASGLGVNGTPANADWGVDFGSSVGTAGDVNGDGFADVVVGVGYYEYGYEYEGRVSLYYGSYSGPRESPAWMVEGNQADAHLGGSVGTAGDVNGDGYADVIVGASGYDHGQTDEGRAFVWYGSASGPGTIANWGVEGNQASAHFGYSVGTAGDVNGDGYADVIVGAHEYDSGQTNEGAAFVYYGSAWGLYLVPSWSAEGDQDHAHFGISVGTAGDVNGDGYADVIVGADDYDHGQDDEGQAFVWYGSATGLGAAGNPTNADWTAESNQATAYFGYSVGTAGDVNGDGYADAIVGAYQYDDKGQTNEGRAFVWYGSASGLGAAGNPANADWHAEGDQDFAYFGFSAGTAGDVDRNGYTDVIVGAYLYDHGQDDEGLAFVWYGSASGLGADGNPSNADWHAEGNQANAHFGGSVGTAGDVNGDGYADVIVGADDYDHGQDDEGLAFVWHGSASGLGADGTPSNADWGAEGNQANAHFGSSVSTAGDVNGDGYADVIVGAEDYDRCQRDEGRAFVYHGSGSGLSTSANWTAEGGQETAYFGHSVGTAGDVNGDGYADVIVGAHGYDGGQTNEGRAFVYYGNGGMGLSLKPRQRRADDSGPIAPLGLSEGNAFRLALLGRTPFGRGLVKLEWEVKPLGTPFSGSGTYQTAWLDSGTAGVEFNELVSGLSEGTVYHWRVRLRYHPVTAPFQQCSRWLTMPWNGWQEQDLRTGSVSVTLVMFSTATYSVGEGAGNATITVNLDAASEDTVTVDYATSDGTATAGDDYSATNGTLTFNPGVTSQTFNVPILDDALEEGNETVVLSLSNATNAAIGAPNPATLTIVDEQGQEDEFHIYLPLVLNH
jgi:hypothetical protein